MEGTRMSSAISLTEAARQAATNTTSMTEEVQKVARAGEDGRVITFPGNGHDRQHDLPRIVRQARAIESVFGSRPAPASAIGPEPSEQRSDPPPHRRPGPEPGPGKSELPTVESKVPSRRVLALGLKLAAVAALALLSLLATSTVVGPADRLALATTQKRVALVIGNTAYRHAPRLENPKNDATDISAVLRKLGFRVIEGFDLDKAGLERKIREFAAALRGAEVGAFFYAGHGLHVSGNNYLVPVDAQLTTVSALDAELVRLDVVHRAMEKETPTNILFFDACRDNPLSLNLARAMGTRSVEIGRGLATVEHGAGTLISFSTQPGKIALDGTGRNSPYSRALAKHLATSNDDLAAVLIAVRKDVMRDTDRKQIPWEHHALTARLYLNAAAEAPPRGLESQSHWRSHEAFEAWSATKDTANIAVLEAFIARFRDTFYAELARARMEELKKGAMPLIPPPGDSAAPPPSQ